MTAQEAIQTLEQFEKLDDGQVKDIVGVIRQMSWTIELRDHSLDVAAGLLAGYYKCPPKKCDLANHKQEICKEHWLKHFKGEIP